MNFMPLAGAKAADRLIPDNDRNGSRPSGAERQRARTPVVRVHDTRRKIDLCLMSILIAELRRKMCLRASRPLAYREPPPKRLLTRFAHATRRNFNVSDCICTEKPTAPSTSRVGAGGPVRRAGTIVKNESEAGRSFEISRRDHKKFEWRRRLTDLRGIFMNCFPFSFANKKVRRSVPRLYFSSCASLIFKQSHTFRPCEAVNTRVKKTCSNNRMHAIDHGVQWSQNSHRIENGPGSRSDLIGIHYMFKRAKPQAYLNHKKKQLKRAGNGKTSNENIKAIVTRRRQDLSNAFISFTFQRFEVASEPCLPLGIGRSAIRCDRALNTERRCKSLQTRSSDKVARLEHGLCGVLSLISREAAAGQLKVRSRRGVHQPN
ncbi:hypothetical protein EVAR_47342_1 [Eumeta japonica]|uniref:Uncharacterized protein n=1 Tax=Eumeta variegata TaxID=151549 RepID=A0A4C1WUB5_EUMVA|nr:hypothetical protein EVAR_47342_1 [Eumeta japonica]